MIIARVRNVNKGQARLRICLTTQNINDLQDGKPIHIPQSQMQPLGIKGISIDVAWGETDEAIAAELQKKYGIRPDTSEG